MTSPLRLALACAASALFSLPLFAADPWDAPPFTADPKALIDAAKNVSAGDADLVLLLDENVHTAEPGGRAHTREHYVYRVVTPKGVERLDSTSSAWQPWYEEKPEIRARVIGPDGSVHTLDPKAVTEASAEYERNIFSDERVLHAPLPGVSVGAVVELVFDHFQKGAIAGAGTSGTFTFASSLPEERMRLVLEGPAGFAPHIINKAGVEARIVEKDGRKQYIFERSHAAADDVDEDYLPTDEMLYPFVAYSTGTSWSELARAYSEVVDKQIAASDVRELAASATRGATKREEIVDRLLAYVEANVHYAGVEVGEGSIVPRVPSGVLKNKYGDCKDKATLLVALLRAAGLPAHVALLHASYGYDVSNELPAMNRFNHAIVVVGGETPLWIDPTDEFARAGVLPEQDQGRMALIAAPETTSLTRTPDLPSSGTQYLETRTLTLPEEGRVRVAEVTTGVGSEEAALRRQRAERPPDKYKTDMEKYAKDYYFARKAEKVTTTDPRDLATPFTLTVEVSDAQAGIVKNGDGAVAVNLHDLLAPVPSELRDWEEPKPNDTAPPAKKRQHDFLFPRPFVKQWTYRIVLPPGYKARTLPQNETKHLGTTTLTKEYSVESESVVLAKYRFDSGKRRLTPAEFEETRIALSKAAREPQIDLGFDSIGQAKLNAGDVRGALEEFRRLAALHPKEAQHHIELARALTTGGLGEAAREEARRAVTIEPNSAAAHYMLGLMLERDLLGRPFHTGCDLPGALAEVRKARQLDPTDLSHRLELAELLVYGEDAFRFSRKNHLAEGIDEYTSILKDFGAEAKSYETRLMLFYAYAGRWDDMKKMLDTMAEGDAKSQWRILVAAATSGVDAATHELDGFGSDKRRTHANAVAQTLMHIGRYREAAAMFEAVAKGAADTTQLQAVIAAMKKARVGPAPEETPANAVLKMFRAVYTSDVAEMKRLMPYAADAASTSFGGSPKVIPMNEMTPDTLSDFMAALADMQTEGSDDVGYRVRMRMFAMPGRPSLTFWVKRDNGHYIIVGMTETTAQLGEEVLKLAAAGKLDAARTWLNWAREEIPAGGGDDPLSGPPFAALWSKDKTTATLDEIRLAAAALADDKKESAAVLRAAREKAAEEQRKWIDVALIAAEKEPAKIVELAAPLAKSHPDSAMAFVTWVTALSRSGKLDEAEAAAKQRLEQSPRNREALKMLAEIAARRGDYAASATYTKRILDELTPTDQDYNAAAWLALFTGKEIEKGIENAQRAIGSNTNRLAAASLHTLAALYAENGKSLEARQALLKSIEKRMSDTPLPSDWYVVGRIAENYGVPEAALAAYKRVDKAGDRGQTIDTVSTWALAQRRLAALPAK